MSLLHHRDTVRARYKETQSTTPIFPLPLLVYLILWWSFQWTEVTFSFQSSELSLAGIDVGGEDTSTFQFSLKEQENI